MKNMPTHFESGTQERRERSRRSLSSQHFRLRQDYGGQASRSRFGRLKALNLSKGSQLHRSGSALGVRWLDTAFEDAARRVATLQNAAGHSPHRPVPVVDDILK